MLSSLFSRNFPHLHIDLCMQSASLVFLILIHESVSLHIGAKTALSLHKPLDNMVTPFGGTGLPLEDDGFTYIETHVYIWLPLPRPLPDKGLPLPDKGVPLPCPDKGLPFQTPLATLPLPPGLSDTTCCQKCCEVPFSQFLCNRFVHSAGPVPCFGDWWQLPPFQTCMLCSCHQQQASQSSRKPL